MYIYIYILAAFLGTISIIVSGQISGWKLNPSAMNNFSVASTNVIIYSFFLFIHRVE